MSLNPSEMVSEMPLGRGVSVLAVHDEGLVAFEKPTRVLSHPNVDADRRRSLLNASWSSDRERYLWKVGNKTCRLYLLHRLDSATSGVILGCVNPNLARELKGQFSKRKVAKSYEAIVSGTLKERETHWKDLLRKRRMGGHVRADARSSRGSPAETRVKLIAAKTSHPRFSHLRMHPLTGRTHQLRVQSAKRRFPIIGDSTYGNFTLNREIQKAIGSQRLFLHASSIRMRWEWKDRSFEFQVESPLPEVFQQLMELKF